MLGVGVAEWTGLFNTSLKKLLMNANPKFLHPIVAFAGSCPTLPLMQVYHRYSHWRLDLCHGRTASAGRMAAAFAGVSGGFSANLLIGTTDPLLTGITNQALKQRELI